MEKTPTYPTSEVPESASRQLDAWVSGQEMPYGYTDSPPPYDTENAESKQQQKRPQTWVKIGSRER